MNILKANWKPVPIDDKWFSEGLVGIEECREYDLKKTSQKESLTTAKISTLKKKRKVDVKSPHKKKIKLMENDFRPSESGNTSQIEEIANLDDTKTCDLNAWARFDLPSTILKAVGELRFFEPTHIQALTLPSAIWGRRDILGAAATGSGKTLAFGLPILTGILKLKENLSKDTENQKPLYALILTPTRELAIQIKNHLTAIAKYTGISVAVVVGGMAAVKQERILGKGPEIVVATPGRLWELIQKGNAHLSQIDNIKFLAIDETDRMLERGHFQELNDLFERINLDKNKLKKRQNFVFSATLTLVHELPKYLINRKKIKGIKKIENMTPEQKLKKIVDMLGLTDPKVVDLSEGKGTSETLTECRITCSIDEKDYYLFYILKKYPGRTLIFCNSIGCVKRLTALLTLLNCKPLPIHASMQQRQRLKSIDRFSENENTILVATDVAARGLDIPRIDHVLHYQTPRTSENYVHRSGRTARASLEGISILLIEPNEFQRYVKLCRTLGKSEDLPTFPVQENYLNAVKKRINLARELDKLQLQVKKANSENGWLQKAAEDMDIVVDDYSRKYDSKEIQSSKKLVDIKKKQLASLLDEPVFPKQFSEKYPLFSNAVTSSTDDKKDENALELVKNFIPKSSKEKKKNVPLFKPRKRHIPTQISYKLSKKIERTKKGNKSRK